MFLNKIILLIAALICLVDSTSGYDKIALGICASQKSLPEGSFPDLLATGAALYDADRVKECMNRCTTASQSDNTVKQTAFYIRRSNNKCGCTGDDCTSITTDGSYITYRIRTPAPVPNFVTYKGCWTDSSDRIFAYRYPNGNNIGVYGCSKGCYDKGYKYSGQQSTRECFCGLASEDYKKHGSSTACQIDMGWAWAMSVYEMDATAIAAALACTVSEVVSNTAECTCGGASCDANKWCYNSACQDAALYLACSANFNVAITTSCVCASETTVCAAGKFCYGSQCKDTRHCSVRADVGKNLFYGAKLRGEWKSTDRKMMISLPVPWDVAVSSIVWNGVTDNALAYATASAGSWVVDSTNPCSPSYNLTVPQAIFFGAGSKFKISGSQLRSSLRVVASEVVSTTQNGQQYDYTRTIKNTVPVLVNLVTRTTIDVRFRTQIPGLLKVVYTQVFTPLSAADCPVKMQAIINVHASVLGILAGQFTAVCKGTTTRRALEARRALAASTTIQFTVVAKNKAESDRVLAKIADPNFSNLIAAGMGNILALQGITPAAPVIVTRPTEEQVEDFVLFVGAEENFAESANKQVKITIQVHSRTCVDHSLTDTGVRVKTGSENIATTTSTTSPFAWVMKTDDATKVARTFEHNLCVESLNWSFVPAQYRDNSYEVELEFTLKASGMTFSTLAAIDIQQGDVLSDIGFSTSINSYSDETCTSTADKFVLGQKFYTKIELSNLVVNAKTITCNTYKVKQVKGTQSTTTDLKAEAKYNFVQKPTVSNTVICGAELESHHFHVSVDGYDTVLETEILITYDQANTRRKLVTIPLSKRRRLQDQELMFENQIDMMNDEVKIASAGPTEDELNDEVFKHTPRAPETDDMIVKMLIEAESSIGVNGIFGDHESLIHNIFFFSVFGAVFLLAYNYVDEKYMNPKHVESYFLVEME